MRKDDQKEKTYFRSEDRVFQINATWWFASREREHGPYTTRQDAEDALRAYLARMRGEVGLDEMTLEGDAASVWDSRADIR